MNVTVPSSTNQYSAVQRSVQRRRLLMCAVASACVVMSTAVWAQPEGQFDESATSFAADPSQYGSEPAAVGLSADGLEGSIPTRSLLAIVHDGGLLMFPLIVVTHLLGTGHLRRALVLADAFASVGHRVLLASGGMPLDLPAPARTRILQLPPLRSDGVNFSRLLDEAGQPAEDALLARRQSMLCDAVADFEPDILITELFPFGRRVARRLLVAAAGKRGCRR